ncbi:hypothetical protein R0G64_31525, partial [Pseudomonas otitidis]
PAVIQAARSGQAQFDEYTDSYGTFRSIFLPMRTASGQVGGLPGGLLDGLTVVIHVRQLVGGLLDLLGDVVGA